MQFLIRSDLVKFHDFQRKNFGFGGKFNKLEVGATWVFASLLVRFVNNNLGEKEVSEIVHEQKEKMLYISPL